MTTIVSCSGSRCKMYPDLEEKKTTMATVILGVAPEKGYVNWLVLYQYSLLVDELERRRKRQSSPYKESFTKIVWTVQPLWRVWDGYCEYWEWRMQVWWWLQLWSLQLLSDPRKGMACQTITKSYKDSVWVCMECYLCDVSECYK